MSDSDNLKLYDILDVVYECIEVNSSNYFKLYSSLNLSKEPKIVDFIRGLGNRFNLFESLNYENIPIPEEIEKYQKNQLKKLEDFIRNNINEPIRFSEFLLFVKILGKTLLSSEALSSNYSRMGRYTNAMGFQTLTPRVDRLRKYFGTDVQYSPEIEKKRQEISNFARGNPTQSTLSIEDKKELLSQLTLAPFAFDEKDDKKVMPKQDTTEKYKIYGIKPNYEDPSKVRMEKSKQFSNFFNTSISSLKIPPSIQKVKENRTHILRSERIKNFNEKKEEIFLKKLLPTNTALSMIESRNARIELKNKGLPLRPQSSIQRHLTRPNYTQPLNKIPRIRKQQSGKPKFSIIPNHLKNPANPNLKITKFSQEK